MGIRRRGPVAALLTAVLAAAPAAGPAQAAPRWVATWGTAMTEGSSTDLPWTAYTVRNFVTVSVGGPNVRITLSNRFGGSTAVVGRATVALTDGSSPKGTQGTPRALTFGGRAGVSMADGVTATSDALAFAVPAGAELAVSVYLSAAPAAATRHRSAYAYQHVAGGDHTADRIGTAFTGRTSWYYLTAVDVDTTTVRGAVVALGDSITDGAGSTVGANRRWTDRLAQRLRARPAHQQLGVVNAGISGNKVLVDNPGYGQAAVSRCGRDIVNRSGIRTAIVLEGVNDIRTEPITADRLWSGYEQIAGNVRANGIRVVGATLLPFKGGANWTAAREQIRQQVNARIRAGQLYDAYVDLDAAVRDPADPQRLRAAYQSGDWLHPSDAGYQAMANAVNLDLL